MKKIELNGDSWYGRLLNHPTNIVALVWGVVWRVVVAVLTVIGAFMYVWLWAMAFHDAFTGHPQAGIAFLAWVLLTAIPTIILVATYDSWSGAVGRCASAIGFSVPQVEWTGEESGKEER